MTLDEYQKSALKTDLFPGSHNVSIVTDPAFLAKVLGLVGEAGEVAEKFKKIVRDKNSQIDEHDKAEIIKELGDVLWYIAALSHYLGTPLDIVARQNISKLADRKARGAARGSGDNR